MNNECPLFSETPKIEKLSLYIYYSFRPLRELKIISTKKQKNTNKETFIIPPLESLPQVISTPTK